MDLNETSPAPSFGFAQKLHLGLLISVLVEYALLMAFSQSADGIRGQLTAGLALFTAAWGALLTAGSIYYGKEDTFKERLLNTYRGFLGRTLSLWSFNFIMLLACGGLLYLLLDYRQVDFYSDQLVDVSASYAGVRTEVGFLNAKTPSRFRMKLGHANVQFSDPGGASNFEATSINVLPFWRASQLPQVTASRIVPKVDDPSDLSMNLVNADQAVPVVAATHTFQDGSIYFDTLQGDLMLSHSKLGQLSISIYRLGIEMEKVAAGAGVPPPPSYSIDVLGETPHGITQLKRYFFTLNNNVASARYLGGLMPADAKAVNASNFLDSGSSSQAVEITANDKDAHYTYKVTVQAKSAGLYRVRFTASYDIAGEQRRGHTAWVYLYK